MLEPKISCFSIEGPKKPQGKEFSITELNEAIEYAQNQGGGIISVPVAKDFFGLGNDIIIKNNKYPISLRGIPRKGKLPTIGGNPDKKGINMFDSNNVTIRELNFQDNIYGICLKRSSDNNITDNTANSNYYNGINLDSSSNNTITNNTANNNRDGIYLDSSSNYNTLIHNTANNNDWGGIYLYSSSNNTLIHNTANSNKDDGIFLYYSSNNILTNNTLNSNTRQGIILYSSSDNILYRNYAGGNEKWRMKNGIFMHPGTAAISGGIICKMFLE
ncbi:MAG: hypothetical protein CVU81_02765 [Euryarchaeota archaeon HGW-Euryarchaeota-1]|nr:MAG: hypothetical protein CVU81_02765 [Euryarchaeota archaeon HGW-Euryarchaeota-1]